MAKYFGKVAFILLALTFVGYTQESAWGSKEVSTAREKKVAESGAYGDEVAATAAGVSPDAPEEPAEEMASIDSSTLSDSVRSAVPSSPGPKQTSSSTVVEPLEIEEVSVKGRRRQTETEILKSSGFAVNAVDLAPYQNLNADINSILSRTAGVKVRQSAGLGSSSEFSVNGMSGKQVRYFIDGVPLDVYGSAMTLSDIPVNLAERVEVYKGVVPISLGSDVLGAAVNIVTGEKPRPYLDASYSYGSFNTHRTALSGQYVHEGTGLVLRTSGFHNYSGNNYFMKGVEVWDSVRYEYVERDFRRFHDTYRSSAGRVEGGVINKPWADALFLGASVGRTDKDVQTGYRQNLVYGEVREKAEARNATLNYRKTRLWLDGLHVNLFASLSDESRVIIDTAMKKYEWDGSSINRGFAERGGVRSLNHITRPSRFVRLNTTYHLDENHSFNFNGTYHHVRDENYNELIEEEDVTPGALGKWIAGAAFESYWLSDKLTTQVFAKSYLMQLQQEQYAALLHQTENSTVKQDTSIYNLGYGAALRYRLFPATGLKASYEHTYRLQEPEEMFGNGLDIRANPLLTPEYSNNFNLGAYQEYRRGPHRVFLEADGFLRNARDFIYAVPYESSGIRQYENKGSVTMKGIEGEASYAYERIFNASANATYQHAVNTTKFARPVVPGDTSTRVPDPTYLDNLPNRPWFFANVAAGVGFDDVAGAADRLQFNWSAHYVHWFYLTWESFGDSRGKAVIPTQFIQNASVTYSFKDEMFNVALECNNFMDALAFDNFQMQKPGRSFSAKLRYFFR